MKQILILATVFLHAQAFAETKVELIERGKYLVKVTGCNDCHTPQYGLNNGKVPESQWLIGDQVGWKGPWGTTYPTNLRKRMASMTEKQWLAYAKSLRTRPPMPWFTLNEINDSELRAMYAYIRSLGTSENVIPEALPPGEAPKGPYMDVGVVMPKTK